MCGVIVDQDAAECFACGENFVQNGMITEPAEAAPEGTISEEIISEETISEETVLEDVPEVQDIEPVDEIPDGEFYEEASEVHEESLEVPPEFDEPEYPEYGSEPPTTDPNQLSEKCPVCQSVRFSTETGDLVSCLDCGNVYTKQFPEESKFSGWKWKFWLGLIFIIIGNFGFALASYIHNVLRWSPLSNFYLGYGWIDTMLGGVGVVLFIIGLVLFAMSFKREREVQCPNCKVYLLEEDLLPPPEEEEEVSLEGVMEEIEEVLECPNCGASAGLYDMECPECGIPFEVADVTYVEDDVMEETAEDVETTDEAVSEDQVIMESLEFTDAEEEMVVEDENGTLALLEEMETDLEISDDKLTLNGLDEEKHVECPGCGMIVDEGSSECPVCGVEINGV